MLNGHAVCTDGKRIVNIDNGAMNVRDAKTGQITHVLKGHKGFLGQAAFSLDGKRIAIGDDGTLKVWSLDQSEKDARLVLPEKKKGPG